MAYGFNEDRSKAPVYTKAEIDAMDLVNDEALADEVEARQEAVAREVADRQTAVAQEIADRQAAVSQEAAARSAGDSALDARISNIIAQGQSTTGNTELIDIRTGYDGVPRSTAGDSVRNQIGELSNCVFSQSSVAGATFVTGGNMHPNNRIRSNVIDFKKGDKVVCVSSDYNISFGSGPDTSWHRGPVVLTVEDDLSTYIALCDLTSDTLDDLSIMDNNVVLFDNRVIDNTDIIYRVNNRIDKIDPQPASYQRNGSYNNVDSPDVVSFFVPCSRGDVIYPVINPVQELQEGHHYHLGLASLNNNNVVSILDYSNTTIGPILLNNIVVMNYGSNTKSLSPITQLCITVAEYDENNSIVTRRINDYKFLGFKKIEQDDFEFKSYLSAQGIYITDSLIGFNGTLNNPYNASGVHTDMIPIINNCHYIAIYPKNLPPEGYVYSYDINIMRKPDDYPTNMTAVDVRSIYDVNTNIIDIGNTAGDYVCVNVWLLKPDNRSERIPLRYSQNVSFDEFTIAFLEESVIEDAGGNNVESEVVNRVRNAKHISGSESTALTLAHFSDIHADTAALSRIQGHLSKYEGLIDDVICTGDIVANNYETSGIASWWNPNYLTCIGNHDSASYNSTDGYNWTALPMADRSAYYIEPFEANWGTIVHPAGASYYYKDYTDKHVRLIVLDNMLLMGSNTEAEAAAQQAWLESALVDAINNNLHVIIGVHAPHGGSEAINCSFSKYNQSTMPTHTDCDTPASIINVVANAINNGLHFVGYLVGHDHKDNVWDALNDGTQLMFSVTCAVTNYIGQWWGSDQDRSDNQDAINVVSIDTTHTLVKIVRVGEANLDDHMRPRRMICFDYSTGQLVGEEK